MRQDSEASEALQNRTDPLPQLARQLLRGNKANYYRVHKKSAYLIWLGVILLTSGISVAGTSTAPPRPPMAQLELAPFAALPPGTYAGPPKPWVQVNDNAFGLDDPSNQTPPYQNEDGFEVTVFNDQLYVGMEADNLYGARVWRTKAGVAIAHSQTDWEQVVDDAFGDVNNNDHIDSLEGFKGHIYASTAQSSYNSGTEVWRSGSGALGSWTQANVDGFGDFRNLNFKDMVPFTLAGTVWLCGGTMNVTRGPQVWCTVDGETWELKNPGWRNLGDVGYIKIWSTGVMDGHLYVGTECNFNGPCPGAVWRTDGTADPSDASRWQWERVFEATANNRMDILGPFDGYMYVGFDGGNGTEVWRSDTGRPGTWVQVNSDGFGDPNNGRLIVDAATIYNSDLYYNGLLYLATLNQVTGAQVWRTVDGTTWTGVNADGFGDSNTFAAELISFNGYLYAWASNYQTGQKVLRTKVPVCQSQVIAGNGTYTFDGVGAQITFSDESLDSVEVCVYPHAFPEEGMSDEPVKRHYEINPSPAGGSFTADLTLSYTDEELSASGVANEDSTYLVRWTDNGWVACPEGKRSRNTTNNTVTCSGVTTFSTFAIAGSAKTGPACSTAHLTPAFVSAEPAGGVNITAGVTNVGGAQAPPDVSVAFYIEYPAAGSSLIGTATTTKTLDTGESEEVAVTWETPMPGDYLITIVADDDGTGNGVLADCQATDRVQQTISILDVPLAESWNLFSAYVNPFNNDAGVVQRPIAGRYLVIQGFDGEALSYYADLPPEVNTLKTVDGEHGYWIKTVNSEQLSVNSEQLSVNSEQSVVTLRIVGAKMEEDAPLELDAGWNLVSYLPRQPLPVVDALRSIDGQYFAVLGYEQGALSYYPELNGSFNTLHTLKPLNGYWIKMVQAGTLQYPATGEQRLEIGDQRLEIGDSQSSISNLQPFDYAQDRSRISNITSTWFNFYGPAALPVGTLVQAITPNGVVCGATVSTAAGRYGLLACYGDDPTTPVDEGARPGDSVRLMVNGHVLGTGTWTAHGGRQWIPLGPALAWQVYLSLVQK